jgi:hypothetical protein
MYIHTYTYVALTHIHQHIYDQGISFEEVIVYGRKVFNIKKQVVGIMAGAKKQESCRESTESFNIFTYQ